MITRIILALVVSQLLAGLSAGISMILFQPEKFEAAVITFILFATIGSVALVPAVFIVESGLILAQSFFVRPSLIFQVGGSALIGTMFSCALLLGGKINQGVGDWGFAVTIGLFGGMMIGLAWFYLVALPAHHSSS